MSIPQKEIPPADLSLKYMAWNIKSMDESLKKISISVESLAKGIIEQNGGKQTESYKQEELTF